MAHSVAGQQALLLCIALVLPALGGLFAVIAGKALDWLSGEERPARNQHNSRPHVGGHSVLIEDQGKRSDYESNDYSLVLYPEELQ